MAYYRRTYSKPGRRGRTIRVGDALPRFISNMDKTGGHALVKLWRAWDDLMGEMAHMVRPLGHRGTKIILAAEDPIIMQEAQFLSEQLLKTINDFLGEEVFDKVVFELLNGRVPLDGEIRPEAPEPPRKLKKPKNLGDLNDKLDPDSPIGRCYRAYRRMFEDS
ncbi:DUF721 domain-containing protein [Pseudodesulfovibrio sediminis]|uniref:DUF721 domain-containing protein n=1 Tax=Pseudodesulfovibrio sediminis TaxID=2810563 RepID=A0ABN6EP67_9BACT|nr:DUF721 domain-containing protein [Pseudodesulfovibrio sediminis]BCS88223.1 hypothetical protein PSDVSF_14650 [Pseudodesulfovibrio sediminis]